MELEVPSRIHIAPLGYEIERVVEPCRRLGTDRLVLLEHSVESEKSKRIKNELLLELEESGVCVQRDSIDIFDFYESLGAIGEQISKFSNEDVFVNISTGSKITAIAGMISAMMNGATPYYVRAHEYKTETPGKVDEIIRLPEYPVESPQIDQIELLSVISQYSRNESLVSKGELIDYSMTNGLNFVSGRDTNEKGRYRLIDTHVLNPLEKRGYIHVTKSGREKVVDVTEEGQDALRAFQYMLENE